MSKKINKKDIAKIISKNNGTTNIEELDKINLIFSIIEDELDKGNDVNIVGFGLFKCIERKPRTVVNPKTSEQFKVGKRISFKFIAGKHLRDIFKRKKV